jgi:hypothetical protein
MKLDIAREILAQGDLLVQFDPRHDDVECPPWLRHQPLLILQVGYNMPIPIADLLVDEDGITGTLSFTHTPWCCHVPWEAVVALVPADAPTERITLRQGRRLPAGWAVIDGGKK